MLYLKNKFINFLKQSIAKHKLSKLEATLFIIV